MRERQPAVARASVDAHVAHIQVRPIVVVLDVEVAARNQDVAVDLAVHVVEQPIGRAGALQDCVDESALGCDRPLEWV